MRRDPVRGLKLGAGSAVMFAIFTPLNHWLRDEPIYLRKVIVGTVLAFILFGIIGMFTKKFGSEIGDV